MRLIHMCRSVCQSHPHPHQFFHPTHAAHFCKRTIHNKWTLLWLPMFRSPLYLQKVQSPMFFNDSTLDRFGFRKKMSEPLETSSNRTFPLHHHDSAPWQRFCSIRTMLLHQNHFTPWKRFLGRRTILISESNAPDNFQTKNSHPDPPKPNLVLRVYGPKGAFSCSCDNPWATTKAS